MKIHVRLIITFVVVFMIFASSDGFAAMYKYLDKDGMICIADDLQSIPEQYRAAAKIVSGEAEAEKKPLQQNQPQAGQGTKPEIAAASPAREQAPTDGVKKRFIANRLMLSIMVVVSALFTFVILGILDADHKKSIKITRVVILWGLSAYLIYAHLGDVIHLFRATGNSIDAAHLKAEEKGKKAAKALKEMNELMQDMDAAGPPEAGGAASEKSD